MHYKRPEVNLSQAKLVLVVNTVVIINSDAYTVVL